MKIIIPEATCYTHDQAVDLIMRQYPNHSFNAISSLIKRYFKLPNHDDAKIKIAGICTIKVTTIKNDGLSTVGKYYIK